MQTATPTTKVLLRLPPQQPNINKTLGVHTQGVKATKDCIQGYENAKGEDKATGYITASVEITGTLAAPNNADSLCKKLKVKL